MPEVRLQTFEFVEVDDRARTTHHHIFVHAAKLLRGRQQPRLLAQAECDGLVVEASRALRDPPRHSRSEITVMASRLRDLLV
jgi:hypothetical protein